MLRIGACARVARRRALCTQAAELQERERARSYKVVEWSLKTMAIAWFTKKTWEYCSSLDTLFAGSSMALVRSRDPGFQSSGVWRIDLLHTTEAGMAEVIKSNGISHLVKTLSHPEPATRLLSLKLLVTMAPVGSARGELVGAGAVSIAEGSCAEIGHAPDAARCRELAAALREALGASSMGGGSAAAVTYSQLVAMEAVKEAAVKRRDYAAQQEARDQCDVLRAKLAARSAEQTELVTE